MAFHTRTGFSAALLCLVACGGGGGGGGPTLTISPQSATAAMGGAAVMFTATLSGSSDPISWALTGPGSITPSGGLTTTYTPPRPGAAATTATLTASAGGGPSASAVIHITPPAAMTVAGRVVGNDLGPLAGAAIAIGTKTAVSDADGRFSISNVTPPYDLSAVVTSPRKVGVLYQGLTRPDPTILPPGETTTPNKGQVTGNVTGGDPPGATNERLRVIWGSPEIPPFFSVFGSVDVNAYTYTLNLAWQGPSSTTGAVHALQMLVDDNGNPTAYPGYAARTGVTVANSGTASADMVMSAPAASTVAGSVSLPPSFILPSKTLTIAFDDNAGIFLASDTSSSNSFSYPFPAVPGGTATVVASAIDRSSSSLSAVQVSGIAPGTTNVVLDVRTPSAAILPADLATNVGTTTDFTWTPMAGTTYTLSILGGSAAAPNYYVFTTATSARIPDFSAQGLALPAATPYTWIVGALGPATSVDDLAGPSSFYQLPGNTLFSGDTVTRRFTTP